MRRKRSSAIAFVLAIALVFSMFPATVSAISVDARNMANLGLLRGVDAAVGVDEAFLAMETQRYQAVVIMARLMGMEQQLLATDPNGPTFTDAAGTSEFVRRTMAFAYANPELGFIGFPDGSFRPLETTTAQQIYKVLLVVAGFRYNVDFHWGQVFQFGQARGLSQLMGFTAITNDQLASALAEGLRVRTPDGLETLNNLLIARGVITREDAAFAGAWGGGSATFYLNSVGLGLADVFADQPTTMISLRFNAPVEITARDIITVGEGATLSRIARAPGAGNVWNLILTDVAPGRNLVTVEVGNRWTRTVEVWGDEIAEEVPVAPTVIAASAMTIAAEVPTGSAIVAAGTSSATGGVTFEGTRWRESLGTWGTPAVGGTFSTGTVYESGHTFTANAGFVFSTTAGFYNSLLPTGADSITWELSNNNRTILFIVTWPTT